MAAGPGRADGSRIVLQIDGNKVVKGVTKILGRDMPLRSGLVRHDCHGRREIGEQAQNLRSQPICDMTAPRIAAPYKSPSAYLPPVTYYAGS